MYLCQKRGRARQNAVLSNNNKSTVDIKKSDKGFSHRHSERPVVFVCWEEEYPGCLIPFSALRCGTNLSRKPGLVLLSLDQGALGTNPQSKAVPGAPSLLPSPGQAQGPGFDPGAGVAPLRLQQTVDLQKNSFAKKPPVAPETGAALAGNKDVIS